MSDAAIVPPSPLTVVREYAVRLKDDPDARSAVIGILGVVLIHLFLYFVAPQIARMTADKPVLHPRSTAKTFNIEITPEMLEALRPPPKPKSDPKQFVETNPDAPENTPDKTNNFAAQNQQVAQEKPTPNGNSERPATEGKKDFESTQIVSGRLQKQVEHIEPTPPAETAPTQPTTAAPRAEQNPLPGFEKKQGDNADAFGTNVAQAATNAKPVLERVEGAKDVPLVEGTMGLQPAIDPKRPRPRPSIVKQQQVRPAILADNKIGTSNMGVTAINAKFSNYGAYLQRLVEAVQLEWDGLLEAGKVYPPSGTYVMVKFVINNQGKVVRFSEVDNHSSTYGSQACVSAITNRAPYGEWTDDMKAALNEEEELVFTFYYQ